MNLFIYCFSVLLLIYCQTASIFVVKGGLISEVFFYFIGYSKKCAKYYPQLLTEGKKVLEKKIEEMTKVKNFLRLSNF